jgi:hypothetical protein
MKHNSIASLFYTIHFIPISSQGACKWERYHDCIQQYNMLTVKYLPLNSYILIINGNGNHLQNTSSEEGHERLHFVPTVR